MRLNIITFLNILKENRYYLFLIISVLVVIMTVDYVLTVRLFNGSLELDNYISNIFLLFLTALIFLGTLIVRLNISNKKALAENRAKNNFLAIMSHEIRTPLNAIIGLGQLEIKNTNLSSGSKNTLEKILISGQNLLRIVNDILDLSKIESNRFEIIPNEYYITSLINDVSIISSSRIASKPIEFKISVSPNIPSKLYGDAQRIKQIVNSFLNNTIKHIEKGFIHFSADYQTVNEKNCLKFEISDSGSGLKREDILKLFKVEKTGIELLVAKRLADTMNSTIEVNSLYGSGCKFVIYIPQEIVDSKPIGTHVAESLEQMQYSAEKTLMSKDFAISKLTNAKVLIVDDVQMNLEVMQGFLKLYELNVDTAISGPQAIDKLKNGNKYDVIFMDHMMPIMDGVETTKAIRNLEGDYFKKVAIVAFTANTIIGIEKIFLENGFDDFLPKPVDIRQLDACLNKWIKKKEEKETEFITIKNDYNILKNSSEASKILEYYVDFEEGVEQFGSEATFKRMLASFKKHTPDLLRKLREQSGNNYVISIHALKGCARTIFAKELGDRAYELETAAKDGDWELVKSKNEDIIRDTERLIEAISA